MSFPARESLAVLLFNDSEREVLDVKFLRGTCPTATAEDLCNAARGVLAKLWDNPALIADQPPTGRRPQRMIAEIFSNR